MRTDITAQHLPRITENDIHRFAGVVDIRDARAFASELQAFVLERLRAVKLPVAGQKPPVEEALAHRAAALHAPVRWTPSETDIQRGRALLLEAFANPHNLPLPEFARLAGKSRQQIYKDIAAHRLLALSVGRRGQKLPDWQLDPLRQRLTESVLQQATGIDSWTIHDALSQPLEGLAGRSPVEAVTPASLQGTVMVALNTLGIQPD